MRPTIFAVAALVVVAAAPLAAAPKPGSSVDRVNDPFEKFNRAGFAIEGVLDRFVIGPLAQAYHILTPGPIGRGIHNVVTNLSEPMVIVNSVLQVRPKRAGRAAARLAINSIFGVAGLIDLAAGDGLPHRPNSFGDTLGRYGMGAGPYLFYPLGGPSSVRDTIGEIVDITADPVHLVNYAYRTEVSVAVGVAHGLDQRVRSEADLKALLSDAADPYATLRSTYLQVRQAEVEGGTGLPATLPDFDLPTTPAPGDGPAASAGTDRVEHPGDALLASADDQAAPLQTLPHQ